MTNKKLTTKDVRKAAWRWIFFHQSAQNYERMMGLAFCDVMSEPLAKLYPEKEEYTQALQRHIQFFNTNANLGALIPGITIALEEERANGGNVDADFIVNVKNALMGPFAGIGDSLIGSTYTTIVQSIAISLALEGSAFGAVLDVLLVGVAVTALKYFLFNYGYKMGVKVVDILSPAVTEAITTCLGIVGLIVVGGVTANTVALNIKYQFVSGDMTLNIQGMIDKVMPGLLSLLLPIGLWLLYRKGWSSIKALIVLVIAVFALTFIGVL